MTTEKVDELTDATESTAIALASPAAAGVESGARDRESPADEVETVASGADEADPEVTGADEAASDGTDLDTPADGAGIAEAPRPWWGRAVALGVAAVVFAGVGTAFEIRDHSLRSQTAAKNHALSDTAATSEVIGQVSTALNKVLSYDYQNPASTQQAATQLLTGDAAGQYKTLFTALQQKAPGEKLTLSAKVVVAGVTQLHGNTAQLLVFLDQSSTRASDKQSSTSAAQLDVSAVKQGGNWKISELLPL